MCEATQWVHAAVSCHTRWINVQVEGSHAWIRWHPPVPAAASSRRRDWGPTTETLQVSLRTWIEHPPAVQVQGKCKQWCSPVPSGLESSHSSPNFFLCGPSVVQKLYN